MKATIEFQPDPRNDRIVITENGETVRVLRVNSKQLSWAENALKTAGYKRLTVWDNANVTNGAECEVEAR